MAPPPSPISIDEQIEENALDPGLMAIPCIVFYVLQLFIDAFIATGWASKFEKVRTAKMVQLLGVDTARPYPDRQKERQLRDAGQYNHSHFLHRDFLPIS